VAGVMSKLSASTTPIANMFFFIFLGKW